MRTIGGLMGIETAIKVLERIKMSKSLTGIQYNALVVAIKCMQKQLSLPKKVMDMQTYKLFDGDKDMYVDREEVMKIVG